MIVTHSPFVLSMLVNSFFLKGGAMGEFAKETINSVIDQLNMYYLCKKTLFYTGEGCGIYDSQARLPFENARRVMLWLNSWIAIHALIGTHTIRG